jgi:hypothetical protein
MASVTSTTDLRKGLEAAGRHDILKEVNAATLKSYQSAELSKLTPDQVIQLAKGLQGAAKDAEKAGDLKGARRQADAAYRITAALVASRPDDPKRLFAHAQSEFWSGFISWREGNGVAAKARFEAYARLADKLIAADPNNDDWRMERAYAAENLGALALRQAGDPAQAERYSRASLTDIEPIVQRNPGDADGLMEQQKVLAWLADSQRLQGHLREAEATRDAQKRVLDAMLAKSPRNMELKAQLLFHDLGFARIRFAQGRTSTAASLYEAGHRDAVALAADDPDNKDFPKLARMFELFEARLWLDPATKNPPPSARIARTLGGCAPSGAGASAQEIDDFCHTLLARLHLSQGNARAAAADLAPVRQHLAEQHDVLTPRWGLDMAAEARPLQLALGGAK